MVVNEFIRLFESRGIIGEVISEVTTKKGISLTVTVEQDDIGRFKFRAYKDDKQVSIVEFKQGNKKAMWLHTYPEAQKEGYMRALHDAIESYLGYPVEVDWCLTQDGEAFYKSIGKL